MENVKSTYGLVGYPLSHSLSPVMHNAAFKELGVDAVYKLFPLKEEELDDFFARLKDKDCEIFGLNVTVPYKEKVLPHIDQLTPFAQKIKAVNTVVIDKDRKRIGFNTDGPGFLSHLATLGVDIRDKRIAILGAGGAARAILSALCILEQRPRSIKVYDIDKEKAQRLLVDLQKRMDVDIVQSVNSIDDLAIERCDILVNATPLGMKDDDPVIVGPDLLHENLFVYDLVYNPAETKLLRLAKSQHAHASNGLGMLFYQGVLAFQHWANVQLDERVKNVMHQSLERALYGQ
jgi:shikimate dehydrogenase